MPKNLLNNNLCLVIFLVFCSLSITAQDKKSQFPHDFFGMYTGVLSISSENGSQNIAMEFHLLPTEATGNFKYILMYGEGDTKDVREYNLIEKEKEKGLYVIDENNGVILDVKVVDNKMYALFEVNSTLLTTFITFETDVMIFEIIAAARSSKRSTHADNEEKTEVISYPVTTVQRAVLKKQ